MPYALDAVRAVCTGCCARWLLYVLATTAARNGMTLIEPTGGIDLDNFGIILQSCLEAGVPRVMPHVYSSIIDPQTGNTRPEDIRRLMDIVKAVV